MEMFERVKAILFKPKEEWTIIEAENASHMNVLTKYLLILALIPTLAFFAGEYMENRSMYKDYIEAGTERIEKQYNISSSYYNNDAERIAQREAEKVNAITEFEKKADEAFKVAHPFGNTKWCIIFALCLFGIIVGGAYISAALINALSNNFGAEKNFDSAFALVAYSFTPLCLVGVLYFFKSFAPYVAWVGLGYGAYLLYVGAELMLKPAADKKNNAFIIAAIALIGIWLLLAKVIVPEIQKGVMKEEYKTIMRKIVKDNDAMKYILEMGKKEFEKLAETTAKSELENHKY